MKREDRKFFQNYSPPTHLYILFDFLCLRPTGTFPKDLSDPLFKLHVHFILLKKNPGLILQCDINVKWRPRPSWNAVHARRVHKKINFQWKLVGWFDNITMIKRWLLLEIVCRAANQAWWIIIALWGLWRQKWHQLVLLSPLLKTHLWLFKAFLCHASKSQATQETPLLYFWGITSCNYT